MHKVSAHKTFEENFKTGNEELVSCHESFFLVNGFAKVSTWKVCQGTGLGKWRIQIELPDKCLINHHKTFDTVEKALHCGEIWLIDWNQPLWLVEKLLKRAVINTNGIRFSQFEYIQTIAITF